jgi:uncharacterized phage protein (TIGR01671 family)
MREIKFRAWDTKEKEWVDGAHGMAFVDPDYKTNAFWLDPTKEIILMQYTGLKDKNGKEIYEGDIVRCEDEDGEVHIFTIGWEMGDEDKFISGFIGRIIRNVTDEIYNDDGKAPDGWTGEPEIIGNIWENEGLLNG